MKRLLRKATARLSVGGAATLLLVISLIGQLLGFLRYKIVNGNFSVEGAHTTSAYFAAFKIPDFFFFTLAAGALGVAFIPILTEHLARGDKKGVWDLTNSLLNLLAIAMAIVGVIIFVFAEPLIRVVVHSNFTPEQMNNAVLIMRLVAFNPLLFTISGILAGAQQTFGRFFFFAMGPLFYNLSITISAVVFSMAPGHNGGPGHLGIVGLGVGALIGACLQVVVVAMGMVGTNFRWRPTIMWRSRDFHKILRLLPARSIDQGIDSINSIVETNFAARLGQANISYYENAYIMHTTPILLIGTSISTAAFPRLTERLAIGRPDLFRRDFLKILGVMIWLVLPAIVICYFCRGYLARMIFSNNAPEIALIFGFFAAAIFFRVIYSIMSRYFYAHKNTVTPLLVSIFAIGLNIVLAFYLTGQNSYNISGLAIAQSIVAAVEVGILVAVIIIRDHKFFGMQFVDVIVRMLSATGFTVIAAYAMIQFLPLNASDKGFVELGSKLAVISAVTCLVYLVASLLLGLDEPKPVIERVKRIILKPVRIQ